MITIANATDDEFVEFMREHGPFSWMNFSAASLHGLDRAEFFKNPFRPMDSDYPDKFEFAKYMFFWMEHLYKTRCTEGVSI